MNICERLTVAGLLISLGACATGMRTEELLAPGAELSGHRTYAWVPDPPPVVRPELPGRREEKPEGLTRALVEPYVRGAVDRDLAAMGYQAAPLESADLWVGFHIPLGGPLNSSLLTGPFRYADGWGHVPATGWAYHRDYPEGTLIIDVIDPRTRSLLWRGTAQTMIVSATAEQEAGAILDRAVNSVLARYPGR